MLGKLALAVGAVAFCGQVRSQAAFTSFYPSDKGGDDSYKGDKGDQCGCFKIVVPEFDSNCDLVKWIQTLDCKENHGNIFDDLVKGCNPKDLGFCLPKCEMKILDDLRSDIQDVDKDFDKLSKDDHGSKDDGYNGYGNDKFSSKDGHDDHDTKELRDDLKCDLTDIKDDICKFGEGLKDACHKDDCHHDHDCDHEHTCAVPLPAASSQGLVGFGLLGCLSFFGTHAAGYSVGPDYCFCFDI